MGVLLTSMSQPVAAIAAFDKVVALDDADPAVLADAHYYRGQVLTREVYVYILTQTEKK